MGWLQDIFNIYARPVPGGQPGDFYMPPEGTAAVIKKIRYNALPVVQIDDKGIVYTNGAIHNIGAGEGIGGTGGVTYNGKTYSSFLDFTKKNFATPEDPLGVNNMAARWPAQTGGEPVVRYEKIKSIDLGWLPQNGGAIIYDPASGGTKIKKVIYANGDTFHREEITVDPALL